MSANREGGQGTQKSGQKPNPENQQEQDDRKPGRQRDQGGQSRQEEQDRPVGGKKDR